MFFVDGQNFPNLVSDNQVSYFLQVSTQLSIWTEANYVLGIPDDYLLGVSVNQNESVFVFGVDCSCDMVALGLDHLFLSQRLNFDSCMGFVQLEMPLAVDDADLLLSLDQEKKLGVSLDSEGLHLLHLVHNSLEVILYSPDSDFVRKLEGDYFLGADLLQVVCNRIQLNLKETLVWLVKVVKLNFVLGAYNEIEDSPLVVIIDFVQQKKLCLLGLVEINLLGLYHGLSLGEIAVEQFLVLVLEEEKVLGLVELEPGDSAVALLPDF